MWILKIPFERKYFFASLQKCWIKKGLRKFMRVGLKLWDLLNIIESEDLSEPDYFHLFKPILLKKSVVRFILGWNFLNKTSNLNIA
jgi:hypothetical protein